jgi:hypothetical protein
MEQGGWKDHRSVLGYVHDVPERRRAIVLGFDDWTTSEAEPYENARVKNVPEF